MPALPSGHTDHSDDLSATGLAVTLVSGTGLNEFPRLTVSGFVDMTTADKFAEAIRAATACQKVILDLTDAQFVSSAAINVLFQRREGLAAVMVGAHSIVARALSLADRKSTRLNSSHPSKSRMPSSA